MSVQDLYRSKRCSAADALEHLHDGDFIIVPTGVGEPPTLLTELSEQRRRFHDIKVGQILAVRKFAYFDAETADHVRHGDARRLFPDRQETRSRRKRQSLDARSPRHRSTTHRRR